MQLNEISYGDAQPIDGYGPGFFRIGGEVVEGAITVLPNGISAWDGLTSASPFENAAGEIDFVLVGTGAEMKPVPQDFQSKLEAMGTGVEIMNTPTACRTFNVLLSEGRRVGLAVLPV